MASSPQRPTRRALLRRTTALAAAASASLGAAGWPAPLLAQEDAAKPITLVVPFAAGSAPDALVRALAQHLARDTGRPVIVDNKPGASSILAAQTVARAAPDGATLLLSGNVAFTANPHTFKRLPYDPVRDFEPIGAVARGHSLHRGQLRHTQPSKDQGVAVDAAEVAHALHPNLQLLAQPGRTVLLVDHR